jgi:acyl-ACP thioesterase
MYHQVEVQKAGDTKSELKTYWLWVNRELRAGEGVIILEEGSDQYWIVERTFISLKNLEDLPKQVRFGSIEPRGTDETN